MARGLKFEPESTPAWAAVAEARSALSVLIEASPQKFISPYNIAIIYAGLGEEQTAIEWLQKAYDATDARLMWIAIDSKWDSMRDCSAFQGFLGRLNLPF